MKIIFEFEGKNYTIVEENKGETDFGQWEEKVTDVTREKEIFTWRPWCIGKKFRWLKKITLKENLRLVRYSGFDDGWSYQCYWKPWKKDWTATEILD